MTMSERIIYLVVILLLVSFNVATIRWFDGHYTELNRELEVIRKNCNVDIGQPFVEKCIDNKSPRTKYTRAGIKY